MFTIQRTILLVTILQQLSYCSVEKDHKCYECATPNLKAQWLLTGFSQKLSADSFSQNCEALSGDTSLLQTSCSGQCLTYIFEDPETLTSNRKMIVRGCLRKLTNSAVDDTVFNNNRTKICEYDKDFRRTNSIGEQIEVKVLVERCTEKLCNAKKDFDASCTDQNADLYKGSELKCYSCSADDGNCNQEVSICAKKYCYKGMVDIHGKKSVYKTCANFNPYGTNAGCSYTEANVVPGNIANVRINFAQCFCNDKEYCNSAQKPSSTIITAVIVVILSLITV